MDSQPWQIAREQFGQQGFAVVEGMFSAAEVQAAVHELELVLARIRAQGRSGQAQVVWQADVSASMLEGIPERRRQAAQDEIYIVGDIARRSVALRSVILDARCESMARLLLGDEVVCHFSNATIRAAEAGCGCNWHQDWPNAYCMNRSGRQLRILICLDGMAADQGATRVIPGSQHWDQHRLAVWRQERWPLATTGEVLLCPPGGIVVLGPTVVHGAGVNLSARPRRTLIAQWGIRDDMVCTDVLEDSVFGLSGP